MSPVGRPFVAVPQLSAAASEAPSDGDGARVDATPVPSAELALTVVGAPADGSVNPRHRLGQSPKAVEVDDAVASLDVTLLGPLGAYVRPGLTDLLVNGSQGLWLDDGGGLRAEPGWSLNEAEVRELAVRLVAAGGRHVDESHPCVDVRLDAGIRVHVVLAPISTSGTLISVRLPRPSPPRLTDLRASGSLTGQQAQALALAVERRENLLITGAAGAGKTTLLAALLGEAQHAERIVTVEDVAELRIDHPHVVGLEARQANLEGAGEVGLARLVREALRMRPDRLVVGECRGAEIRELLAALNTGHDGGAGTLHANSLADVPARLEALGALAGMTEHAVARQSVSAIGLVLHVERDGPRRRLASIGHFRADAAGRLGIEEA